MNYIVWENMDLNDENTEDVNLENRNIDNVLTENKNNALC
jgi:hypothetical protein